MKGPSVIFQIPTRVRQGEEWEPVEGFPDYAVSDAGRVWSDKQGGQLLSEYTNESNIYSVVGLYEDGERKQRLVHSLVMQHHKPDRWDQYGKGELEIDHIDGDPQNNALDNLRYVTSAENEAAKDEEPDDSFVSPAEAAPF